MVEEVREISEPSLILIRENLNSILIELNICCGRLRAVLQTQNTGSHNNDHIPGS